MKTVVFVQNKLLHYRYDFYNEMSKYYKVIVFHSGGVDATAPRKDFQAVSLKYFRVWRFFWQIGLNKAVSQYRPDAVVLMANFQWVSSVALLLFKKQRTVYVWWGLDAGSSALALVINKRLSSLCDSVVFYNKGAMDRVGPISCPPERLHIANNTFNVPARVKSYRSDRKDVILFVGSFDKRKKLKILIDSFSEVVNDQGDPLKLVLIGDGDEKACLESYVKKKKYEDIVEFVGRLEDPTSLSPYYERALASVSYGQAGLSILQSFGFGVPFVTYRHAISGGEISNIKDGFNGILCGEGVDGLKDALAQIVSDEVSSRRMGLNAYNYYSDYCNINCMVQPFSKAIEVDTQSRSLS